jgi:hypothetical protein
MHQCLKFGWVRYGVPVASCLFSCMLYAFADRPIELPIPWQIWITDAPGGAGGRGRLWNRGE